MGFITTDDGTRLHYEILGAGEKTILFAHGYFDSGENFAAYSAELQKKYRVVVYDHRAHGSSDSPQDGYTMTRLAMDMKCLVDQLALGPVTAIGYSMGVHVIYRYIELYGVDDFEKVVLTVMSPKLLTDDDYHLGIGGHCPAEDVLDYIITINRSLKEYTLREYSEDLPEEHKQAILANSERIVTHHAQGPMIRLLIAMFEHDFWPMLSKITCPALVIAGESDIYPTATQEEVSRRIPGSKLVILKDCGHLLLFERPEAYMQELAEFIG